MKYLLLFSLWIVISFWSCKKTSTDVGQVANQCKTDSCILQAQTWRISSITDEYDLGKYTSTLGTDPGLVGIPWATFLFNRDSTVTLADGGHGDYTFTDTDRSLILTFNALPLHFNVTSLATFSLVLTGNKVQMHPRTDLSLEATYTINSVGGDLHDKYGVDTSTIHYVQTSLTYY